MRGEWNSALSAGVLGTVSLLTLSGAVLSAETPQPTPGAAQPSEKKPEREGGPYFRLKVNLTYKGTPQNFDIVASCKARITRNTDGTTYEVGLVPTLFGRRMADNKAIVIRLPAPCQLGETTANGLVPEDFMPLVVVYDNADTLAFGTAYMSQDAYENPLSLMTFKGATIEKATRQEFEDFRAKGEKNVVTSEQYNSMATSCQAYARFRIPDEAKPLVRQAWPADRPSYWTLTEAERKADKNKKDLWRRVYNPSDRKVQRDIGGEARDLVRGAYQTENQANHGLASRDGKGRIGYASPFPGTGKIQYYSRYPQSYYPLIGVLNGLTPEDEEKVIRLLNQVPPPPDGVIDFRGGDTIGFAHCARSFNQIWRKAGVLLGYPGPTVITDKNGGRSPVVNDVPADAGKAIIFFEQDEFFFRRTTMIELRSTGGDI